MDDLTSFRLDETAVRAAMSAFSPIIAELDSMVDELRVVADDLRRDCAGHHSGLVFEMGHRPLAESATGAVEQLLGAVTGTIDDIHRACEELSATDRDALGVQTLDGRV
jgi:hypothetical protein